MAVTVPMTHPAADFFAAHWSGQRSCCVLDTGFAKGESFLASWRRWRNHSARPTLLHYAAILSPHAAAALQTALHLLPPEPDAQALANQCYGLGPGFHRILLQDGQVSLTLCVGELQAVLAQLEMQADAVWLAPAQQAWDKWTWKALARNCRRGTAIGFADTAMAQAPALAEAGFMVQTPLPAANTRHTNGCHALYNPHWEIRTSRRTTPCPARAPGRCAIVGAGIAGASIARALALRGWQVLMLDAQPTIAGGASGLPVGLVVPHHSADDNPRSRMSRVGTRLMLQHAERLLQSGQDWGPGGVFERNVEASDVSAVEAELLAGPVPHPDANGWASPRSYGGLPGLWHPHAAWIKPAQLVAQWLDHPKIHFLGNAAVHVLERKKSQWLLRAADGTELACADTVVFANAHGCVELLQRSVAAQAPDFPWVPDLAGKLGAMERMLGTLSLGPCPPAAPTAPDAPLDAEGAPPPFPVNGHGSLVWGVPTVQGRFWYAGSTFRTDAAQHADLAQEHATNLRKLALLLPAVAKTVAAQFHTGQVQAWQGSRCISHDRLPLVGPLEDGTAPTLWMSTGMGARGLSFSALCAELLVAQLGGEPLPLERNLAQALDTRRRRR